MRYILLLFSVHFVQAQSFIVKNFTTNDGLPSSETYHVVQSSSGYLWIGTDQGVARYDGRKFRTFTSRDGLIDNTVLTIREFKGKMWLKTLSNRINYLEGDKIKEYKYTFDGDPLPKNALREVLVDEAGKKWLCSYFPKKIYREVRSDIYALQKPLCETSSNKTLIDFIVIEAANQNFFYYHCYGQGEKCSTKRNDSFITLKCMTSLPEQKYYRREV